MEILMKNIKVNELSSGTKNTMKQRLLSSVYIAMFFIILFLLGILADNVNNWSPINSLLGRQICAWILLIFLLPMIYIGCREINNIFFKFNPLSQILITFASAALIYAPTLIYFLKYYDYLGNSIILGETITQFNTVTNIFAIALASAILLTIIINTILLVVYHHLTFKNWFILNLLVGVISGFYLGTYFFLFTRGWLSLLWLMLIVFGCDSFSYFGGLLFGKHQMAKKISPKKTWEGFAVGQVVTILVAMLILFGFSYIQHDPNVLEQIMGVQFKHIVNGIVQEEFSTNTFKWWISMFFITTGLSLLSVFGDLTFSWFKRKYHIKDYGTLIPGHGGILDRIDSHSVVISSYFILSFFLALFANTVVFFTPIGAAIW